MLMQNATAGHKFAKFPPAWEGGCVKDEGSVGGLVVADGQVGRFWKKGLDRMLKSDDKVICRCTWEELRQNELLRLSRPMKELITDW
jgi:hypothetical protein